jgi:hypothetical protein
MEGYCKANTFYACYTHVGLDKTIWFACFNGVLKQCGLDFAIIYVSIRVLEFWVMETTNIYDFLHLLSLITMKPNMDFGGDLAFAHICHNIFSFFKNSQRKWKAHKQRPN